MGCFLARAGVCNSLSLSFLLFLALSPFLTDSLVQREERGSSAVNEDALKSFRSRPALSLNCVKVKAGKHWTMVDFEMA